MSEVQGQDMGVSGIVQELTRLEQHAAQARKVLVMTGEMRPGLLEQLRGALIPIGIDCVEIQPEGQQEYFDALPLAQRVSIGSFAELLASPALAPLMADPPQCCTPAAAVDVAASMPAVAIKLNENEPAAQACAVNDYAELVTDLERLEPASDSLLQPEEPVVKLDMTKPANWKRGDVFRENPKFTLLHQQREWFIKDIDDLTGPLSELNIEIERVSAYQTQLMTIQQFMRGYVFVRHAETPAK